MPPHLLAYVVAPLAVSRLGRRRGRPRLANLAGVPLVVGGATLIGWAIASHHEASPADVQVTAAPDYLVTDGAYARTRNRLYVGGAAMWAGWSVLLDSPPTALAGTLLFTAISRVGVPFEERMLSEKFGPAYERYRASVPRWIGRR